MKSGIVFALALLLSSAVALAGNQTPRADQRQQNQDARIDQGVVNGELNAREEARLDAHQQHIDNVENRAKADGHVSVRERARLERKQDRASRRIARQKHDRQARL